MGGLAIKLDMFQSLALAVIAIWLGNWCRQKFPFLRKYCLPGAVVGGTIISTTKSQTASFTVFSLLQAAPQPVFPF